MEKYDFALDINIFNKPCRPTDLAVDKPHTCT